MLDPGGQRVDRPVTLDGGRRPARGGRRAWRRLNAVLIAVLIAGLALGGCTIPFGGGGEPSSSSPEEARRERNRLFLEEQERMERKVQFDRVGPSDR